MRTEETREGRGDLFSRACSPLAIVKQTSSHNLMQNILSFVKQVVEPI